MTEYFRILYLDHKLKKFNISCIINDDTDLTLRTAKLQDNKQEVSICTFGVPVKNIKEVPTLEVIKTNYLISNPDYEFDPNLKW